MIRISKGGKKKYISLGISVHPDNWDFEKNKPKRKCPNKENIEKLIREQISKYNQLALEYKANDKEFTISTLIDKANQQSNLKTVDDIFQYYICDLKQSNRLGYALSVTQVYNSLLKFNKHLDIHFVEVDLEWLKRYEKWLRDECKIKENTIGIRFRTLRVIYNLAIDKGLAKMDNYPFKAYKVSKLHSQTAKRAITKEEVLSVMNYKVNSMNMYKHLAVDLFSFSYLMAGINMTDIAKLTKDNIVDNRLVYIRQKTKKLITIPIHDKAMEIIKIYQNPKRKYLFPILSNDERTEMQKRNRIIDVIANINGHLKKIGKELNIPVNLTTYVSRHSYATVLKRSGVSTSLICESLGHSSEKITQIYLANFFNEQIDEAMKNLL